MTVDRLDTFARRTGLQGARETFYEGLERARQEWPEIAEKAPLRMRRAIPIHWKNTPILNHFGGIA